MTGLPPPTGRDGALAMSQPALLEFTGSPASIRHSGEGRNPYAIGARAPFESEV